MARARIDVTLLGYITNFQQQKQENADNVQRPCTPGDGIAPSSVLPSVLGSFILLRILFPFDGRSSVHCYCCSISCSLSCV